MPKIMEYCLFKIKSRRPDFILRNYDPKKRLTGGPLEVFPTTGKLYEEVSGR